jgi:hypothetical protein
MLNSSLGVRLLALAAATFVAACGDATSPASRPPSAESVARHFDSLYAATIAGGSSSSGLQSRASVLTYLELAPAYGATPSAITTSTITATGDSTVHAWSGFEIELVTPNVDSSWYFVAYSDADVTNAVVIAVDALIGPNRGTLLANDTLAVMTNQVYGAFAPTSIVGTACVPVSGLSNPGIAAYAQTSCFLATYNSVMVGSFVLPDGVDPSLAKIIIASTTWHGIRFVE